MADKASHAAYMRVYRALRKPQRVPDLQWPTNLYGHPVAIEDLLRADATYQVPKIGKVVNTDHLCACGCSQPHNHAVSRVTGSDSPYGYTRKVLWYRTLLCRNRHMGLVK